MQSPVAGIAGCWDKQNLNVSGSKVVWLKGIASVWLINVKKT
jgi:hypothetical protein